MKSRFPKKYALLALFALAAVASASATNLLTNP
jgi:hypothetical protein